MLYLLPILVLGTIWSLIHPLSFFAAALFFASVFPAEFLQTILFSIGPMLIYPFDIVLMVMVLSLIGKALSSGFSFLADDKVKILLLIVFFWGVFQSARGLFTFGHSAIGQARTEYLYMIPMFYLFAFLAHPVFLEQLHKWIRVIALAILVMGVIEFAMNPFVEATETGFRTRYLNATSAMVLSFGMIHYLERLITRRGGSVTRLHQPTLLLLVLFTGMVILAQHRTVWLSVALMFLASALLYRKHFQRYLKMLVAASILVVALLIYLNLQTGGSAFVSVEASGQFIQDAEGDPTARWRLLAWGQAIEKGLRHPLLGEGFGDLFYFFDGYQWWGVAVHNGYIMRFLKQGLVGLVLLIVALTMVFRYGRTSPYRDLYLMSVGHVIFMFFYGETYFLWSAIAIVVASVNAQVQRVAELARSRGGAVGKFAPLAPGRV